MALPANPAPTALRKASASRCSVPAGPSGNAGFPSIEEYLAASFDARRGAFRYLSGLLDGSDSSSFRLRRGVVKVAARKPTLVLDQPDLKVEAVGVPHGSVPALGYRVSVGGTRLVFSGDQNGKDPTFWKMADRADLLVMAHAVPESVTGPARDLHATPGTIGQAAAAAGIRHLVLSHLMARSLDSLPENLAIIRRAYAGPLDVASDLACYPVAAASIAAPP